jgi:hypothetical protein
MKNTINSPITGLDAATVDQYLPFEGKEVWIWHISKTFRSYGHWTLTLDIEVEGRRKTITAITTNSQMIDNWDGSDENDHVGKLSAINEVLGDNEERLLELAEQPEPKTNK